MSPFRRTVRTLSIVLTPFVVVATLLASLGSVKVDAASHREAPLISSDPDADNTDTYAFISPDRPDSVTLVANYIPFEHPDGGPNYNMFNDQVLYEIHVDNVGDAKSHITYQFEFETTTRNPNTFLYNTGTVTPGTDADRYPNLNVIQTYTLREIRTPETGPTVTTTLGSNLEVPPVNVGPKSTPNYEALVAPAIHTIGTGADQIKAFAGQRDDSFWVDLGSVFDLLSLRGQAPPIGYATGPKFGLDSVAGYNVHTIALQVPISGVSGLTAGSEPVIGVWATASRYSTRVLNGVGGILSGAGAETHSGPQVQVSRLGMPLVNEVVIPRALKDAFNNLKPEQDADIYTQDSAVGNLLEKSVLDPELQRLLKDLYGVPNPGTNRKDLETIFLTGIKTTKPFTIQTAGGPVTLPAGTNVNQPANVRPAEMIRLNTAAPFRPGGMGSLCKPEPDYKLGLLGGDACGFPNGRRLQDDVTEIELLAVAGAAYSVLTNSTFAFNADLIGVLTDSVTENDKPFLPTFPYVATPHQGTNHKHDQANVSNLPMIFRTMEKR